MDKKIATISLLIFIVAIFTFAASMAWFIVFKERVCSENLNSATCGEHYGTFLRIELGR